MAIAETTPQGEVSTNLTEEQAASALLDKWNKREEASDEPTDEPGDEPGEGDLDDLPDDEPGDESEDEPSGDFEIDVAGQKFKLPPALIETGKRIEAKAKEVEAGATRKFQEAANKTKAAEQMVKQAEEVSKIAHAQADLIGDHKMVTQRLQALERIDINRLGQEDPAALARMNAEYTQLMAAKGRIEGAYQQKVQEMDTQKGESLKARFTNLKSFAESNIKDWNQDRNKAIMSFAQSVGLTEDFLKENLDESLLKVLDAAEYGDRVRKSRLADKRVPPKTNTLKPGAPGKAKVASVEKAQMKARKTGSVGDAAAFLLARHAAKR